MPDARSLHRVTPGRPVDLGAVDPADTSAAPGGKGRTKEASLQLVERLAALQEILWARGQERVLVVLQGIDTSGKGGTVEHVFGAVNPAGLKVTSFKAPSESERARDYLWRVHANVPAAGEIGVFDRSHYEDVLAVRVLGLVEGREPVGAERVRAAPGAGRVDHGRGGETLTATGDLDEHREEGDVATGVHQSVPALIGDAEEESE